jgi:four helix bundle protein
MNNAHLKARTKQFAVSVIKMAEGLPNKQVGWTISGQIMRSCSSVAANYRAVNRAKSDRDFISKMETVIEECDETLFWLEMIVELNLNINKDVLYKLMDEANQLTAIFVSSVKTIKKRLNQKS